MRQERKIMLKWYFLVNKAGRVNKNLYMTYEEAQNALSNYASWGGSPPNDMLIKSAWKQEKISSSEY